MLAILCRRRLRISRNDNIQQFVAPKIALLVKTFSSEKSSSGVRENVSEKSFNVSYLINSCGLSASDAISASKNLCFESPEKPDAVLEFLREYGFTNADITRLVIKWPQVLLACPNKTLLPKLDFFRSIGVPLPVLAKRVSAQPSPLKRGLQNNIIPTYDILKSLLQSGERVAYVFIRAPRAFGGGLPEGISSNITLLRERGVPESSIVSMVMRQPSLLIIARGKLAVYVDRAVEMGFDASKGVFANAIRVFAELSESTLKRKMEVYRRCGWLESDVDAAFLRHPSFMSLSEKKIMANMDFLVHELGCEPSDIARNPVILKLSLEKRLKPRCLVVRILNRRELLKKRTAGMKALLLLSEELFLERYVVKYQKEIPELLDVYRGKLSPSEMDSGRQ